MEFRQITERFSVSPQIDVPDVARVKEAGFAALVNNRPDGEVEGQPWHDDIEEEAARLGLSYHYCPVISVPYAPKMIARMGQILDSYEGRVLSFCRTGTRSTRLWAFTQAGRMSAEEIIGAAARAGYDISALREYLV